jgi:hypothetical protein
MSPHARIAIRRIKYETPKKRDSGTKISFQSSKFEVIAALRWGAQVSEKINNQNKKLVYQSFESIAAVQKGVQGVRP